MGEIDQEMLLVKNALYWKWEEQEMGNETSSVAGKLVRGWLLINKAKGTFERMGYEEEIVEDEKEKHVANASASEVVDFAGSSSIIFPGLIDAHIHVGYMGEAQEYVDLSGCRSIKDLQGRLREYCQEHPQKTWIVGVGWDQSQWERYPSRQDLDAVTTDRPIVSYRACWHIVVANSKALEAGGISLEPFLDDEEGVDLDNQRVPTGILKETAVPRVTNLIFETDEAERVRYFKNALARCLRNGITAVQTNDVKALRIYQGLLAEDQLPLRVFLTINHEEMEENGMKPIRSNEEGGLLSCPRVKLYSDGSLGAETAALRQPYVGTENTGVLIHTAEALTAKIRSAHEAGFQLEVHAIGDRALETVLDAFEAAGVMGPDARPVITHCQVMGEDLMARMSTLGVIANIQPSFVGTDSRWVRKRIPQAVQRTSYCWRTLMYKYGIPCAGGSDAPVEDCNPLMGLYDAMYRLPHSFKNHNEEKEEDGHGFKRQHVFLPEECLTFAEALWLYTVGGAYACQSESTLGKIAPGYAADFIVVDRDVSSPHSSEAAGRERHPLLDARVEQVWVNGTCRFDKNEEEKEKEGTPKSTVLEGPYISGKNGSWKQVLDRRRGDTGSRGAILHGKRLGMSCCDH